MTYRQRHANWTDPMGRKAMAETRRATKAYVEKNRIKRNRSLTPIYLREIVSKT
jgi:hypothetical protein